MTDDKKRLLRHGLKVPGTSASSVLKILSDLRLLDRDSSFKNEGRMLFIPLMRIPQDREIQLLRREIGVLSLCEGVFEVRKRRPHDLIEALSEKMPAKYIQQLPKSFDIVGDIAMLESGLDHGQFEERVAGAILEVHPNVRAVFAKAGPVSGPERVRPLRHIAGENRTETLHREFGCDFRVDLSKVYFSPRLSTEHERIARQVAEGETVIDMFAGVGPFSILIAKKVKNVEVHAIDSNPSAANFIRENARRNKVREKIHVHLGEASAVARRLGQKATRVIMNHPSGSRMFVAAACNTLRPTGGVIHYYTFAKGETPEDSARMELDETLESSGSPKHKLLHVHRVREVAPRSWQIGVDAQVIKRG